MRRELGFSETSAAVSLVAVGAQGPRTAETRARRTGPGAVGVVVGRVCEKEVHQNSLESFVSQQKTKKISFRLFFMPS